jgi:hypothetical protein
MSILRVGRIPQLANFLVTRWLSMTSHTLNAFAPRRSGPTKNVFRAFAPGGIGNLGPGIDILGCAMTGPGDIVEATAIDGSGVRIHASGHPDFPSDPEQHASGVATCRSAASARFPRRQISPVEHTIDLVAPEELRGDRPRASQFRTDSGSRATSSRQATRARPETTDPARASWLA